MKNKSERGEKVMKKVSMVLVLIGILSFSIVTFAGWEFGYVESSQSITTSWKKVVGYYNYNDFTTTFGYGQTKTISYNFSCNANIGIVAASVELGFGGSTSISETISIQAEIPPMTYYQIDSRALGRKYSCVEYFYNWLGNLTDQHNFSFTGYNSIDFKSWSQPIIII
ncbi:MAG TPA: hypothetical protein DEA49_06915 [Petrotoga sp.]|nr:hypothetical protein [Petrotoga sp.]